MDYYKKRKIRRVLYSRAVALIVFIVLIAVARGTWDVFQKERESRSSLKETRQDLSLAQEKQRLLSESVDFLSTQRGKEEIIRDKFSVNKEGEKVVIVLDNEEPLDTNIKKDEGFFEKIGSFFHNIFK